MKPIYLLVDSRLLFWKQQGRLFLETVRRQLDSDRPKAAYIGASNGDEPEFYGIFEAAMEGIRIKDCRHIPSTLTTDDEAFLNEADLILLAGGDVERGWRTFEANGLTEAIIRRYYEGALLMGISAGAVQLGWHGWSGDQPSSSTIFDTFKLVPFIVSVHQEKNDWSDLKKAVELTDGIVRGIGIPTGGGLIYHEEHSVEPLMLPLYEVAMKDERITHSLIFPPSHETPVEVAGTEWIS